MPGSHFGPARVAEQMEAGGSSAPIARVRPSRRRDLGFTALLIILQSWADTSYPFGLVRGLPAVGFAPHYGVFPQQPACMISQQDVLDGWLGHNHAILQTLRAGKDDEVLLEQSEADAAAGFCTPPLTQQQLQAVLQQRPYRLIPRCIIVQSSGKKRIIDNADAGGQSERSQDSNKLVLCTPLHFEAVMRHMTAAQVAVEKTGPMPTGTCPWGTRSPSGAWWHSSITSGASPPFRFIGGFFLGCRLPLHPSIGFHDWWRAWPGGWCTCFAPGSGQWALNELNKLLAAEKHQPTAPMGLFWASTTIGYSAHRRSGSIRAFGGEADGLHPGVPGQRSLASRTGPTSSSWGCSAGSGAPG